MQKKPVKKTLLKKKSGVVTYSTLLLIQMINNFTKSCHVQETLAKLIGSVLVHLWGSETVLYKYQNAGIWICKPFLIKFSSPKKFLELWVEPRKQELNGNTLYAYWLVSVEYMEKIALYCVWPFRKHFSPPETSKRTPSAKNPEGKEWRKRAVC